jgi:hypothetical protein
MFFDASAQICMPTTAMGHCDLLKLLTWTHFLEQPHCMVRNPLPVIALGTAIEVLDQQSYFSFRADCVIITARYWCILLSPHWSSLYVKPDRSNAPQALSR